MRYLLDTGILLRVADRDAAEHALVRRALARLHRESHLFVSTHQNRSEFWNVCTRATSARGGMGLTVEQAHPRLRLVERIATLLPESVETYGRWRELVLAHRVLGVQVHDVRLVATMLASGVTHLLTLNDRDFRRYEPQIAVVHPRQVLP